MIPAKFEYVQARDLADAIRLLQSHGDDCRLLAGGHSLLPMLKLRMARPALLIDIGRLAELRGVAVSSTHLSIGALTTHGEAGNNALIVRHLPVIAEAAQVIADPLVRNRGTIGGSLANADPAADWPALMIALDAKIEVFGPQGIREIPAEQFFQGPFSTSLHQTEILTLIRIPLLDANTKAAYRKFRQPASGYAVAGVAAVCQIEGSTCTAARLGVTGVGDYAYRAFKSEKLLAEAHISQAGIVSAAITIAEGVDVLADGFADARYRAQIASVTAERAIRATLFA